ncbi:hypothetical protein LINPERHAP1_LOCUS26993 [Linum perenne]
MIRHEFLLRRWLGIFQHRHPFNHSRDSSSFRTLLININNFHLGITTFFICTYSSTPSVCDNASLGFEFELDPRNLLIISDNPSTLCGKKMYIEKLGPSSRLQYGLPVS